MKNYSKLKQIIVLKTTQAIDINYGYSPKINMNNGLKNKINNLPKIKRFR